MRMSPCGMLGIILGAVRASAGIAATPSWRAQRAATGLKLIAGGLQSFAAVPLG